MSEVPHRRTKDKFVARAHHHSDESNSEHNMNEDDVLFEHRQPPLRDVGALIQYTLEFINDAISESNRLSFYRSERLKKYGDTDIPYSKIVRYCTDCIVLHTTQINEARKLVRQLHALIESQVIEGRPVPGIESPSKEDIEQERTKRKLNTRIPDLHAEPSQAYFRILAELWTHAIDLRRQCQLKMDAHHARHETDEENDNEDEDTEENDGYGSEGFVVNDNVIEYEEETE